MTDSDQSMRRDLESLSGDGSDSRFRIVACDVSGTFTRVTADAWNRLTGRSTAGVDDPTLLALASEVGWTQTRSRRHGRRWSWLAIQIPLVRIDQVAGVLAKCSDWIFAPFAVAFWVSVFAGAVVAVVTRWTRLTADLSELPGFLATCHPLVLISIIVMTKVLHELGHAVMCRRVGAKCGDLGVMLFCGIPCPYCDVTQIWREPSAKARMAVMFAGIYVEWVLTSVAVLLWCLSGDPVVRMYAMNVMVLCGISTLIFNANPLMRYDGYYVLADWIASPDLRREASMAFRSTLAELLRRPVEVIGRLRPDRALGLSIYHVASCTYRVLILIAIAGLIVRAGDWLGFRMASRVLVAMAAASAVLAARRPLTAMVSGHGDWQRVARFRRWGFAGLVLLGLLGVLCVPMPGRQNVQGRLDASDALSIYLPRDARLIETRVEFGDLVTEGELMAIAESTDLEITAMRRRSRLNVASMQTVLARHRTVSGLDDDRDWMTYETAQKAAEDAASEADRRLQALRVAARSDGMVVPPWIDRDSVHERTPVAPTSLNLLQGQVIPDGVELCRIAVPNQLAAILVIESDLRGHVRVGDIVRLAVATEPGKLREARVESIAEADTISAESWQPGTFEVRCRLKDPEGLDMLANLGADCQAIVALPPRSLAQRALDVMAWWIYE